MILLSRLIAALAYAGAAFLFGIALGERGELGFVQTLFAWVIPIATAILTVFTKAPARPYVLLTGLVMFGGVLLGQHQFARAWNECLTRGYEVRDALVRYNAQHDAYPARLEELGIEIPCRCGFRKTILRYLSNERGFRLWMTNDRESVAFSQVAQVPRVPQLIPRADAGSPRALTLHVARALPVHGRDPASARGIN